MPNQSFTIRPAHAQDVAAVVVINQQGQESVWPSAQFEHAINGPETFWVLETELGVSAFLLWHSVLDEAEIYHFGVKPTAQRQGLAGALLQHLFQHCQQQGIIRLFLDVREGNEAAKALYLKHGFAINGKRKHYYQTQNGPEDAILMEKIC